MFSPMSVCWLVCNHNYTKTTQRISTKLGWRMGLGPEQTPETLGTDLDKGTDPGIFPGEGIFKKHFC